MSRAGSVHKPLSVVATPAGGLSLLLGVALVVISLRVSNPWLLLVSSALLTPVVISQVIRTCLGSVTVCWIGPERIVVGESARQVLHVHNQGKRGTPALRMRHVTAGFEPVLLTVPVLPPGGMADVVLNRTATTRGDTADMTFWLATNAPFGLATHHRLIRAQRRVVVHPARGPVARLSEIAAGERATGQPAHSGSQTHGLREWRRGDALRQVHWRATARHDRLTVVVPEVTIQARFALVVGGSSTDPEWEALLSTAAWTAVDAAVNGHSLVRLSAPGAPDYLGEDAGAVLDWFAGLKEVAGVTPELLRAAVEWSEGEDAVVLASTRPLPPALPQVGRPLLLGSDGSVQAP